MTSFLWIGLFLFLLLGMSKLMGERKGNITFDFEDYYIHLRDPCHHGRIAGAVQESGIHWLSQVSG